MINNSFMNNYDVNKFNTDLLTNIFSIIYPFAFFPSSYLIDQKGIQKSIRIGAIITIIGSLFKVFINTHVAFVYIGQILIAFAQPFIINTFARSVSLWFRLERVY